MELLEKRRLEYEQCMDFQIFQRDCAQMDVVIVKQEVSCTSFQSISFSAMLCIIPQPENFAGSPKKLS